jgi:hypothetical protein
MSFRNEAFSNFNNLCNPTSENVKMRWQPDLNDYEEHLVYEAHLGTKAGAHLNATCIYPNMGLPVLVTPDLFEVMVAEVKAEVKGMLAVSCAWMVFTGLKIYDYSF